MFDTKVDHGRQLASLELSEWRPIHDVADMLREGNQKRQEMMQK